MGRPGLLLAALIAIAAGQCPTFMSENDACHCSSYTDGAVITCVGNEGPVVIERLKSYPMVIRELSILNANIVEIGPRAFRNLQIKNLRLDHNKIARIDPDAFKGLESTLVTLSVSHNALTEIPTDALVGMRALNNLNLRCNEIGNIFGSMFQNMSNLIELNLGCNKICQIKGAAFDSVRVSLQSLLMDQNCLDTFPTEALSGFPNLIGLHLEHNSLKNLTADSFPELPGLLLLRLTGNALRSFPNNASTALPNLRYLYLDQNHITNIEPNVFQNYKNLEILDLSYNQIPEIPANAFKSIETLTQLKLQGNNIRILDKNGLDKWCLSWDIGPNAFDNTPLLLLLLNDNCITSITRPIFQGRGMLAVLQGIPFLRQLSLANNGIRQVQALSFTQLPNLHILDLARNRMRIVEPLSVTAAAHTTVLLQENPLSCTSAGYHIIQGGQPIHLLSEPNLVCLRETEEDLPFLCPASRPRPPVPICCSDFIPASELPTTTTPRPSPPLVFSTVVTPPAPQIRLSELAPVRKVESTTRISPIRRVPSVTSRTSVNMKRFWRLQNADNIERFTSRSQEQNDGVVDFPPRLSEEERRSLLNRVRRPGQSRENAFAPVHRIVEEAPATSSTEFLPPAVNGVRRVPIPNAASPDTALNPTPFEAGPSSPEIVVDPAGNIVARRPQSGIDTAREFLLSAPPSGEEPEAVNGLVTAGSLNFPDVVATDEVERPSLPPGGVLGQPSGLPNSRLPPEWAIAPPGWEDPNQPEALSPENSRLPPAPVLPPASQQPIESGSLDFGASGQDGLFRSIEGQANFGGQAFVRPPPENQSSVFGTDGFFQPPQEGDFQPPQTDASQLFRPPPIAGFGQPPSPGFRPPWEEEDEADFFRPPPESRSAEVSPPPPRQPFFPPATTQSPDQFFFQEAPRRFPPGTNHNELNPLLTENGQLRPTAPPPDSEQSVPNTPPENGEAEWDEQPQSAEFQGFEQLPPWMQERLRRIKALAKSRNSGSASREAQIRPPPSHKSAGLPTKPLMAGSKPFAAPSFDYN